MKKILLLCCFVMLCALPVMAQDAGLGALRIGHIEGDVQIQNEETREWVPASANMPLRPGDRIWVPDEGRVELQSSDGSFVRLDRETSLDVLRIEDKGYQFSLNSGRAYVVFQEDRGDLIQIDTPIASVRLNQRARAKIDADESGETDISMLKGTAVIEDRRGEIDAREGEVVVLKPDQEGRVYKLPAPDEWERWNLARDRGYAEKSYSRRYLPDELRTYSYDFDNHGRWVDVPEYGWVWTPRTVVVATWAPYRHGRWVWVGHDYVWVSHEPWGWAPYHYGRWAYASHVGWFWVPPRRGDVFWAPGFVAWVHTHDHVSWVPLAPGELYYGRGHYGRHSVNVTNVTIINKQVNIYKNVHVHNAVTHVHRDSFVKGHYRHARVDSHDFNRQHVHAGRPHIEATRETRMPVVKEIRADRRPPQKVVVVKPERFKEERRLVKDRERSVFNPERKPQKRNVQVIQEPADRHEKKIRDRQEDRRPSSPAKSERTLRGRDRDADRDVRPDSKDQPRRPEGRQIKPSQDNRERGGAEQPKGKTAPDDRLDRRERPEVERRPASPERPTGQSRQEKVITRPDEKGKSPAQGREVRPPRPDRGGEDRDRRVEPESRKASPERKPSPAQQPPQVRQQKEDKAQHPDVRKGDNGGDQRRQQQNERPKKQPERKDSNDNKGSGQGDQERGRGGRGDGR